MLIKKGCYDFSNKGKQYFISMKVPRVFTEFIRSNFFIDIFKEFAKSMADALLTRMSIFPNFYRIFFTASITSAYFLKSHDTGKTYPEPPIYWISF